MNSRHVSILETYCYGNGYQVIVVFLLSESAKFQNYSCTQVALLSVHNVPLTGQLVSSRQLSPCFARNAFTGPQFYKGLKKVRMMYVDKLYTPTLHCVYISLVSNLIGLQHRAILGHLAPVFCVLFDHTGQCIITVSLRL